MEKFALNEAQQAAEIESQRQLERIDGGRS
jgi:hypothetical protein